MAINTVFAAVYYPLPFDGNRQNRGAPPMRCAVFPRALPWPDGRPNLNGLCPGDALPILLGGCTPWRSHTLATDSKNINLAAAAAAFDIFQIGFLLLLQHEKNPGFCGLGFFILTVFIPLSFRPFRF